MTIRDYIGERLRPLGIGEAQFADMEIALGMSLENEYNAGNQKEVNVAMITGVTDILLAPRMESVNESGFSMSWNFADLGKWYVQMCRRWGVKTDDDVLSLLGINAIIDRTDYW